MKHYDLLIEYMWTLGLTAQKMVIDLNLVDLFELYVLWLLLSHLQAFWSCSYFIQTIKVFLISWLTVEIDYLAQWQCIVWMLVWTYYLTKKSTVVRCWCERFLMISTKEIIKADLMWAGNTISSTESREIVEPRKLSKSREPSKDFTKRSWPHHHHHRFTFTIRGSRVKWFNQFNLRAVRNI